MARKTAQSDGADDSAAPELSETIDLAFTSPLPAKLKAVASLVVTAKSPRRRAGRAFGKTEAVIPLVDLTDAEIVAITGDQALTVMVRAPTRPPAS